jgi:hypothetical protein
MTELAAVTATVLLFCLSLFQVALIAGVPIGRYAWGGNHRVLPTRLRVASVFSIILYALFSVFILTKAGLFAAPFSESVTSVAMWILTGYFFLGILMNGISRSKPERLLMTPVAALLAALFLLVSLN